MQQMQKASGSGIYYLAAGAIKRRMKDFAMGLCKGI